MQTIDQICTDLKLNSDQTSGIKAYIVELVIDLLESLKEDNLKNFEETIENLKNNNRPSVQ